MYPMVQSLSDQDIADLAAYFAAQTPNGLEADPSYWKAGEALYRGGDANAQHSGLHSPATARSAAAIRRRATRRCRPSTRSTRSSS